MSTTHGNNGVVKAGAGPSAVGEVKSFNVERSFEPSEDTAMGDTDKTFLSAEDGGPAKSWSGQLECHWDAVDAGQAELTIGSKVALELYPGGDSAGKNYLSGDAIITSQPVQVDMGAIVSVSFSFQGTGPLTDETVGA